MFKCTFTGETHMDTTLMNNFKAKYEILPPIKISNVRLKSHHSGKPY